jgi:hypothetical protein
MVLLDDETQIAISMTVHADSGPTVSFQSWEVGTTNGMTPVTVSLDDAEVWLAAMLEQVRKAKAVKP